MGESTRIAWCDATFNPWVGCLRVSTACDRCYAAALSWRYGWRDRIGRDLWDPGADRKRTSPAYWRAPLRWNERAQAEVEPVDVTPWLVPCSRGRRAPISWIIVGGES